MKRLISAHFFPSHKEKRRAKLLRHKALSYYLLLIFSVLLSIRVITHQAPGVLGYASNIKTSDLLRYTNEQRSSNGLSALTLNSELSEAAKKKAEDMFKNDYWAHVSPSGTEPWYFFNQAGYEYVYAGENLAKNFNDSNSVVKAWMNSPSHRENLLNGNYDEIGFAVVNGELEGYKTTLVVQFFGKQKGGIAGSSAIDSSAAKASDFVPTSQEVYVQTQPVPTETTTLASSSELPPLVDISLLTKTMALVLGVFLLLMFGLDLWYSSTQGVVKVNGHTLAHMLLLIMFIAGLWFAIVPGRLG